MQNSVTFTQNPEFPQRDWEYTGYDLHLDTGLRDFDFACLLSHPTLAADDIFFIVLINYSIRKKVYPCHMIVKTAAKMGFKCNGLNWKERSIAADARVPVNHRSVFIF